MYARQTDCTDTLFTAEIKKMFCTISATFLYVLVKSVIKKVEFSLLFGPAAIFDKDVKDGGKRETMN